ncbi:MAG: CBS domain-containing protein [Ramlibacter sp.]|jgi:CBS domain-containing protein|nr:CBS domain-containing protein [Ramlibacter sp.]
MSISEDKLSAIAAQLKKGVAPSRETVRSFLLWFGAERRGYNVVRRVRSALKRHGLSTTPDFEYTWLDGTIGFVTSQPGSAPVAAPAGAASPDPTFRIGRLDAANKPPTSVKPDSTLAQAVTVMLTNDFSQLPVMTGPRDLKGIVSWKTIGSRLALKRPCTTVREAMEPAQVVSVDESLFDAIAKIASHDYVLVQAADKTFTGIVTASDFNFQFQALAEPFLLVGEIENGLRGILHQKFSLKELEEAKAPGDDGRIIESPSDLTLGEYVRLIEPEKRWKKLRIEIDRVEFLARLNRVREVRNDVMHFDPDGLDPDDLVFLREFAQFLKRLRDVGAV